MNERFGAFRGFVLSYLHEDWRLEDPDKTAVASRFVRTADAARRAAVVRDIDGLLSLPGDENPLHDLVLYDYHLSYDPYDDGLTMRDWLTRTRDEIAKADCGDA